MKKKVFGRTLGRDSNERQALFKNLMSSLVLHEKVETTEAKAKAIRGSIEKLVTKARKNGKNARRMVQADLLPHALEKFVNDVVPRFEKRPGGYTRIIRLGNRFSDNAAMVVMEWTEKPKSLELRVARLAGASAKRESKELKKAKKTVSKKAAKPAAKAAAKPERKSVKKTVKK
ncbi:MAG TPA: 50S ribosomal protein L17 [Candidatus Saccharimonadales bacterium]|nr:50S ribosomal protein L17 [Candidatus Saccharimonadales bacterium]